jgi:hypothetical protein
VAHRPIRDADSLPVIAIPNRVEFVNGPRNGLSEDRAELPVSIVLDGGLYRRSVRCAEDGAMRYVWRELSVPDGRT